MATHSHQTVGVLLFNLGGPDTTADVEPCLKRRRLRAREPQLRRRAAGITNYRRTEALNTHPLFIEALATLVTRHVEAHP